MEVSMHKLLTGIAAAASIALFASAAQADCTGHVTAEKAQSKQSVAMSTYDGKVAQEVAKPAATACAEGQKDCAPATK